MSVCQQDLRCQQCLRQQKPTLCLKCEVPFCAECHTTLKEKGTLPQSSLANEMWTGYAPERLLREKVTAICASPCITTLTCMTMEAKYRTVDRPLDAVAHMARHTFGARGNALTFPLPLEELFLTLQDQLEEVEEGGSLVLPRVGEQLSEFARVLLRANKGGETTEEEVKSLIHQAIVRRQARHNRQNESRHAF